MVRKRAAPHQIDAVSRRLIDAHIAVIIAGFCPNKGKAEGILFGQTRLCCKHIAAQHLKHAEMHQEEAYFIGQRKPALIHKRN